MLDIFLIFLGFILLVKGADFLVDGASNVAKRFHIPEAPYAVINTRNTILNRG